MSQSKPKPWLEMDNTLWCSHCGKGAKTSYVPGDTLQLCSACFHDKEYRALRYAELSESAGKPVPVKNPVRFYGDLEEASQGGPSGRIDPDDVVYKKRKRKDHNKTH